MAKKRPQRASNFYEAMPGTYLGSGHYQPTHNTDRAEQGEYREGDHGEDEQIVQQRMLRQGLLLLGLLVLQIILFVVLIRSTVNLG